VNSRRRGSYWERAAESFLRSRGLKPLKRNFQARFGEIDLIMLDGETLVFAEVRYRRNDRYGSGAESVTPRKQQRIIRAARLFLQYHDPQQAHPCRFDVISIGRRNGQTDFRWIRDAFDTGQG